MRAHCAKSAVCLHGVGRSPKASPQQKFMPGCPGNGNCV
jgi:hypothetical protein